MRGSDLRMTEQKQVNKEKERFVYIYNPDQSSYYLSQGIPLIDTGIHPKTKHVWFKFSWEATVEVYGKWCNRTR